MVTKEIPLFEFNNRNSYNPRLVDLINYPVCIYIIIIVKNVNTHQIIEYFKIIYLMEPPRKFFIRVVGYWTRYDTRTRQDTRTRASGINKISTILFRSSNTSSSISSIYFFEFDLKHQIFGVVKKVIHFNYLNICMTFFYVNW